MHTFNCIMKFKNCFVFLDDADASDVQPPDEKEILAKGLPLLEFSPVNNHHTDNSGKEIGERSHQYSEKDGKSERSTSKANNGDQQKSNDKYSKYKHDKKSSGKDEKSSDKDKNRKSTDKEKERKSTDREKNKTITDREKDRKSGDKEKDRKSGDMEKDKKSTDKEKYRKSTDKEKDKKSMDKERDKRSSDKEKDRKSSDKGKDKKSSDKEKDKKSSDKEKDRKSSDKIYIAKDKRVGERPSSKSAEKKDIKSHDKEDKGKSSSKYSSKSSGHARSSHKDKDSDNLKNRDKENSDKDPASTMKKIPKLSEKAQLEKSQAATSKSPLVSLDSEMSKGILSLIGITGNHSNITTPTQQIQDRPMQQQMTNGDMSSNLSDYTNNTEVDNTIEKDKERDDGNLTAGTSSRETFPKSILRPVGAQRKGLNVKFTLPTYSQTEENKRLEQLATHFPKEKWAKNCFPGGKLPVLPYQQNVPVSQQSLISAGGPIVIPHVSIK